MPDLRAHPLRPIAEGSSPVVLGVGFLVTLASAYLVPALPSQYLGSLTIVLFALCTLWMLRFWREATACPDTELSRTILALGVLARLLLVGVPAFTTHDAQRYLWDGAVLLNGFDPYQFHPDHPALAQLREVWPTPAEHTAYQTLYPPLALAIFAACALAGPVMGVWVWKLVVTGASIGSLVLVHAVLKRLGQQQNLALFALSPLVLLEVGIGAHVDTLSMLAICAMLWCCVCARWSWAGVAIGMGASIKLLPLLALGPLLFANPWRRWGPILAGASMALLICYGLAWVMNLVPVGSLATFFAKWRFGSPVVSLFEGLQLMGSGHNAHVLLTLAPVLALAVPAGIYALWCAQRDLMLGMTVMLSVPLVLSPMVFPWYLMILVPLLALRPNPALLIWVTTVPLTYEVLNGFAGSGVWQPAVWPLCLIASGWLVGVVFNRSDG